MSTAARSKSARRPDSPSRRRAFTLIELLVVVAIIALLISILLPALSRARDQARTTACAALMHGIGKAMAIYTSENDEWIPGINTTGVAVTAVIGAADRLNQPWRPVQNYDWFTPLMRYDAGDTGDNRAKRYHYVTNRYSCASLIATDSQLFGSAPDRADFDEYEDNWIGISYLMPVHFQYWGQNQRDRILASNEQIPNLKVRARSGDPGWEVVVPDYISRVDKVGLSTARKIMAADGTRYLPASLILDHDINPFAGVFGSFTSSGAWWRGSTAYGIAPGMPNWDGTTNGRGSPSRGANLGLSYRHNRSGGSPGSSGGVANVGARENTGSINAIFWDGHVQRLGDRASREPEFWYPRGAEVTTPAEGMTDWDPDVPIQ